MSDSIPHQFPSAPMCSQKAPHWLFLDGLRGMAALYVVFHHWYEIQLDQQNSAPIPRVLSWFLSFGHYAVDLFIVLSGFCLMIPVILNGGKMRGGLLGFARRRFVRIVPPYYAAIFVTLVLTMTIPSLQRAPTGSFWFGALPGATWPSLVSHLLLVQNTSQTLIFKISPPMWSVATEWQIYFVFALFLIPMRRAIGTVSTFCVATAVSISLHELRHHVPFFPPAAAPWYVGLFALGMLAAEWVIPGTNPSPLRRFIIRYAAGIGSVILFLLAPFFIFSSLPHTKSIPFDLAFGAAAAILIAKVASRERSHVRHRLDPEAILSSKPVQYLGTISYSLYLIHAPVLVAMNGWMKAIAPQRWLLAMSINSITTIAIAFIFWAAFERPFLRRSAARTKPLALIAANTDTKVEDHLPPVFQ